MSASLWLLACGGPAPSLDGGRLDAGPDAGSAAICERETDCEDGLFCTEHRCRPGAAEADPRGCVLEPGTPCESGEVCDETLRRCVATDCSNPDRDDDGHDAMACGGDDCDDDDPNRYAGNAEVCDSEGHDEDCLSNTFAGATDGDLDGDGEISSACCNGDACGADCDDTNASVNSSAAEQCNGVDDDCSGVVDDAPAGGSLCPGGVCTAGRCSFSAWDRIFGGSGNDGARAITSDAAGNVYITGTFGPGVDFGTGPVSNAVVVSYGPAGELRWVLVNEDETRTLTMGFDIGYDRTADRVFLVSGGAARFGSITFDGGPFLAAIETGGAVSWIVSVPPAAALDVRDGMIVLASGFSVPVDPGDGTLRTPAGTLDGYIAAYDSAGIFQWMHSYGGPGAETHLRAVSIDEAGNVYATGEFSGTVDFGAGAVTASGSAAIPVVSVDATGAARWARTFDSAGFDRGTAIDSGRAGVSFSGALGGPTDFGGGPVGVDSEGYLVTLTMDGSYRWERVFRALAGSSGATPHDVQALDDGRVWVIGEFAGTVDFGGGGLSSFADATGSTADVFMVLYGPDRAHLRDRALGEGGSQRAFGITIGTGGATTIAGQFSGSVDFGSGRRTSPSGSWGFVARTSD